VGSFLHVEPPIEVTASCVYGSPSPRRRAYQVSPCQTSLSAGANLNDRRRDLRRNLGTVRGDGASHEARRDDAANQPPRDSELLPSRVQRGLGRTQSTGRSQPIGTTGERASATSQRDTSLVS
jgi:hypothetical protein